MNTANYIPASKLTEADLQRNPVWKFNTGLEGEEGLDESHVSPHPAGLHLGGHGSFMVYATYSFKNGTEFPGSIQVDLVGSKIFTTPVFLYVQGKSVDPLAPDLTTRLARITKTSMTRPIKWRLNVPIAGEATLRSGRIAQSSFVQALVLIMRLISLRFTPRNL